MIDPSVAVEDVDPEAFAHVNAVLSRRDRSTQSSVTVVHEGVGSLAEAEAVRERHGVDQAVLLDRRGLDDLSEQLVALARSTRDQGELLAGCRQAYLDHWAVTVVPAPSSSDAWSPVRRLLESVPDGEWIEVAAGEWTLAAQLRDGSIVRITSRPPEGARRAVRVEGSVEDLDAVLSAANPLGELRARAGAGSVRIEKQGRVEWPS